jgi:hypothetical protein
MRDAPPPLLALDKTAAGKTRQELTGLTQFALYCTARRALRSEAEKPLSVEVP